MTGSTTFAVVALASIALAPFAARAASDQEIAFARDGYTRLSGPEARSVFTARTFSDGTHFSYEYRPDGSVVGMGNGVHHRNAWSVEGDRICFVESDGRSCYAVWLKGDEVRLVAEGWDDIFLSGTVR